MSGGNWHTYKKTYDVHIDREGEIVVTWHGISEVVPGDDRDLIQWAFDQGREFERVQPTRWKASPANWCEATMAERDLTMREAAVKIHEVFLSLMDAGFTEQQALYLCGQTMSGGSNDG